MGRDRTPGNSVLRLCQSETGFRRAMADIRQSDRSRDPISGGLSDWLADRNPTHTPDWEWTGRLFPMETTVDSVGRIVVPKPLRDALGLLPGTTVDVTAYGAGLQVLPAGRTARIVEIDGGLAAESTTTVTDEMVFVLIDSLRR